MWVCIFKNTHYGMSGNELPPPVKAVYTYAQVSKPGESLVAFTDEMAKIGMSLRRGEEKRPRPAYSWRSDWGWEIAEIRSPWPPYGQEEDDAV